MQRRKFFTRLGTGAIAASTTMPLMAATFENSEEDKVTDFLKTGAVQHMVIFDLKHQMGSALAEKFLKDGQYILSNIPVVQYFQVFDQVSLKNDFTYGFSMVFNDKLAYDIYINHADHVAFVENRWKKEVSRFMEIDFKTR
jgi:hypothetical protein